ncbi:uncharacterized protein LOC108910331 [Anoplophora glabripennis]|uniref:uncharacterized protein LOC108910331 n=1 Tax=Anoplophora glabripennis TaxID=217634 RepID=UPI0008735E8C|nr:uncharacterized protein LOC108910331 [Anoplophora glabripennis]
MPRDRGNDDNSLGGRDKSRGLKHQKDKNKYKAKSVKDPKHVPPKVKRNLGSNWDRYETEDDSQSPQLTSSTDFSILANAPIAQGQHFQFKQDKVIAKEIEKTPQELFSLDLNMLKHSILTVPFYERVGIDEKYFTKNQISFMNRSAENSLLKYSEKYNSNRTEEKVEDLYLNTGNDSVPVNENQNVDVTDLATNETEENENVSELINLETKQETESSEEDLEKWLDDILDD